MLHRLLRPIYILLLLPLMLSNFAFAQENTTAEEPAPALKTITLIYISKKDNQLRAFAGDELMYSLPVATGRNGCTPTGTFKIYNKSSQPGSKVFGPRWMGLNKVGKSGKRYGIHGTNDPSSIGKYRSAGCVRLYNENILELYEVTPLGTKVIITNDPLPPLTPPAAAAEEAVPETSD